MASTWSRVNIYFKNIYLDYFDVYKEVRRSARNRPLRATLYGASSLFVLNLFRTNEGLNSYKNDLVAACTRVGSVVEESRNPASSRYVERVAQLNLSGQLRQVDLGFATLVYRADANPEVALYRYNCPYLKPSIRDFFSERVVDMGFSGHWLMLELKMLDYDINEKEYENLPFSENFQNSQTLTNQQ